MTNPADNKAFVNWFRHSSPYIHAFRGRTFVITFDGDAVSDPQFAHLIHDIALLNSLGVRLVLVHGARPQIEQRLKQKKISLRYVNGLRVTDEAALVCVKDAAGSVRVEIEALLSMGLANSPMAGARIRVASGNFVTARPLGVRDGVDYLHTGEVRRVDHAAINQQLGNGTIVLLSPLGYSPTGEVFNLTAWEVATAVASALQADKLLFLSETKPLAGTGKSPLHQLTLADAEVLLARRKRLAAEQRALLKGAIEACSNGVRRTHIINRHLDGALLIELFTRDGIGTMVSADSYEATRRATIDDVGGILELIAPLETDGTLVRRSREQLELEINGFYVIERDGAIIACAALLPFENTTAAEVACLAVHPDYRKSGRGDALLGHTEQRAKQADITSLYVLTTRALHWFRERGFTPVDVKTLPVKRRALYNYQRNSKVFVKQLT